MNNLNNRKLYRVDDMSVYDTLTHSLIKPAEFNIIQILELLKEYKQDVPKKVKNLALLLILSKVDDIMKVLGAIIHNNNAPIEQVATFRILQEFNDFKANFWPQCKGTLNIETITELINHYISNDNDKKLQYALNFIRSRTNAANLPSDPQISDNETLKQHNNNNVIIIQDLDMTTFVNSNNTNKEPKSIGSNSTTPVRQRFKEFTEKRQLKRITEQFIIDDPPVRTTPQQVKLTVAEQSNAKFDKSTQLLELYEHIKSISLKYEWWNDFQKLCELQPDHQSLVKLLAGMAPILVEQWKKATEEPPVSTPVASTPDFHKDSYTELHSDNEPSEQPKLSLYQEPSYDIVSFEQEQQQSPPIAQLITPHQSSQHSIQSQQSLQKQVQPQLSKQPTQLQQPPQKQQQQQPSPQPQQPQPHQQPQPQPSPLQKQADSRSQLRNQSFPQLLQNDLLKMTQAYDELRNPNKRYITPQVDLSELDYNQNKPDDKYNFFSQSSDSIISECPSDDVIIDEKKTQENLVGNIEAYYKNSTLLEQKPQHVEPQLEYMSNNDKMCLKLRSLVAQPQYDVNIETLLSGTHKLLENANFEEFIKVTFNILKYIVTNVYEVQIFTEKVSNKYRATLEILQNSKVVESKSIVANQMLQANIQIRLFSIRSLVNRFFKDGATKETTFQIILLMLKKLVTKHLRHLIAEVDNLILSRQQDEDKKEIIKNMKDALGLQNTPQQVKAKKQVKKKNNAIFNAKQKELETFTNLENLKLLDQEKQFKKAQELTKRKEEEIEQERQRVLQEEKQLEELRKQKELILQKKLQEQKELDAYQQQLKANGQRKQQQQQEYYDSEAEQEQEQIAVQKQSQTKIYYPQRQGSEIQIQSGHHSPSRQYQPPIQQKQQQYYREEQHNQPMNHNNYYPPNYNDKQQQEQHHPGYFQQSNYQDADKRLIENSRQHNNQQQQQSYRQSNEVINQQGNTNKHNESYKNKQKDKGRDKDRNRDNGNKQSKSKNNSHKHEHYDEPIKKSKKSDEQMQPNNNQSYNKYGAPQLNIPIPMPPSGYQYSNHPMQPVAPPADMNSQLMEMMKLIVLKLDKR